MLPLLLMLNLLAPSSIDVTMAAPPVTPPAAFSYDAIEPRGRRKSPAVRHASEDVLLDSSRRSKLLANSRDIHRNYTIAGWMVRKHLDYVSQFEFHSRSGAGDVDDQVERLMREDSRRHANDVAGRHRLSKMLRLAEARRVIDGDIGLLKLASGQLQAIEGDRIAQPPEAAGVRGEWLHGVKTNPAGRALAYAIHRRFGERLQFERTIAASNLFLLGYFDRFDQVRGISPIVAALNDLRDTYEARTYALLKAKVSQFFAMAFFRDAVDSPGLVDHDGTTDDAGDESKAGYSVDFGKGPAMLDLDPGDRAEFLESKTPSTEFQAFIATVLMVALKALDLPYSFYDESHTNFFGSRAAWMHYERSCKTKRDDLVELLQWITAWRMQLWLLDGRLILPGKMQLADLQWEWVPSGMPWWDPAKEIRGDLMAVMAGLDNPERIAKERGRGDVYDNIDATARVLTYARDKHNLQLSFDPGAGPTEVESDAAD